MPWWNIHYFQNCVSAASPPSELPDVCNHWVTLTAARKQMASSTNKHTHTHTRTPLPHWWTHTHTHTESLNHCSACILCMWSSAVQAESLASISQFKICPGICNDVDFESVSFITGWTLKTRYTRTWSMVELYTYWQLEWSQPLFNSWHHSCVSFFSASSVSQSSRPVAITWLPNYKKNSLKCIFLMNLLSDSFAIWTICVCYWKGGNQQDPTKVHKLIRILCVISPFSCWKWMNLYTLITYLYFFNIYIFFLPWYSLKYCIPNCGSKS